ncbi:MAG: Gfo/Idh/MocA family oxidoreductase [Planctomycetota bacterium]|nr:Gfo/Idh/MocA family oxidoreductase [Planctomycetota bacterium]
MSNKLRVVLAGCGGMAKAWLNVMKDHPRVEVAGLADLRLEAAEQKKADYGLSAARVGTDLAALLADLKPDLVVDVTIPAAHKAVTLAALAAGCHVLGEKPLADSLANAREMIAAAEKAGKIYMVSQNYRWQPQVRALRQAVAGGLLGDVTTVNVDFYIGAHFGGFRDEMAHPLLLDMSIHHFDLVRCVTQADPEAVYCREFNPKGSWYKGDVAATAVFEMSGGVVFTYRGSWCAEGHNTGWNGLWRVVGTKGSIAWDGASAPVAELVKGTEGFKRECERLELPIEETRPAGQEGSLLRLLEALDANARPETWCGDNLKSLAMVFGAVESAEAGARLPIRE